MNPRVGDRVRVERDETRYPSKGTWPQFRCRPGTVVEVNRDRKRPHLTEYGLVFAKVSPRRDRPGKFNHGATVTWFKAHEITRLAPERPAERVSSREASGAPEAAAAHSGVR